MADSDGGLAGEGREVEAGVGVEPAAGRPGHDLRLRDYAIEDYLSLVLFWLLAATVFAQFFTRYVLNDSIAWTEEVARYLLVCVTFLGGAMAVRKNSHIHVEFFYRYLPRLGGRVLSTVVDLVRILFFAVATRIAWKLVGIMHTQQMASVDVPMSYMYAVVFAGFLLMTLRSIQVAWRHWRYGESPLDRHSRGGDLA